MRSACLTEDVILALGRGQALADVPGAEAHFADCATCSALLANAIAEAPREWNALSGTQLGPYKLEAQIGAGGMGAVYRATDTRLNRSLAIKLLHGERLVEARAAAAIDHPAVVAIHDVGTANGTPYVAMELVEGESLRSVIQRGGDLDRARQVGQGLADALTAAHERGVIHRDLKPENLIVAKDGRLRVLDFGLAKIVDADPLDATVPGTIQGTAGYMAPEQARGEPADARADIFAVGAIMYEVATGSRAFPGATHADRLTAVLRDPPPPAELGALAPIIERAVAKDPALRFQSASDLAWAIRRTSEEPRGQSRRAWLVNALGLAAVGTGGFLFGSWRAGRGGTPSSDLPPEFRQLTYQTGRVYTARFSPDGNRVVFGAAWDGGPVRAYAYDLSTGTTDPLGTDGDVLAISPRGEVALSLDHKFTEHQSATGTLAVRMLAGGTARTLAERVQDADYDPNGELCIIRRTATGFALELPAGTQLVESKAWITHARISPDGKRVAYLEHPNVNDDAGDLRVIDRQSGAVKVLTSGWHSIAGVAWDRDGSIWFTAGKTDGQNAVHRATLDGTVTLVGATTGRMRIHDLARSQRRADAIERPGSAGPRSAARRHADAIVSVDTWRLRAMVDNVDRSLTEISMVTDLSAKLAVIGELGSMDKNGVYLAPLAGGTPTRLGDGFPHAISPSSARVAATVGESFVLYAVEGAERPVLQTPGMVSSARFVDETSLIATSKGRVWRIALDAAPEELSGRGGRLAIDQGRTRCAFVDREGRLHVIDLKTREDKVIGTFERRFCCGWLAEPDAVLLVTLTSPLEITRVDPATGTASPHTVIAPPPLGLKAVDSVVMLSDGVHVAFSYGQELSQLYVMRK